MAKPRTALATPEPMTREVVTPEGVDLRLKLAEASERAAAFLIDAAIMIAGMTAFTFLAIMALAAVGEKGGEAVGVIWLFGFFVVRNFYFMLFELTPRAATPGKRMLGLRVATRSGGALTADAIFARNAMRELEVYLPAGFLVARAHDVDAWLVTLGIIWCGVFVFFPLFNRDRLRVGDIIAGTWVVKAPRRRLLRDLAQAQIDTRLNFDFTAAQLDAYGIKELHVLESVLRRYEPATVSAVADRIRGKIEWTRAANEGDGDFLDAYYRALRGRLESRLLFGRRRKDKFDRA